MRHELTNHSGPGGLLDDNYKREMLARDEEEITRELEYNMAIVAKFGMAAPPDLYLEDSGNDPEETKGYL